VFGFLKRRRRRALQRRPVPASWPETLGPHLPIYGALPPQERQRLHGLMHVFLAEKHFEGCNGLQVDETMRVVVSAHACLLILADPGGFYPGLYSVLLYPEAFRVQREVEGPLGEVVEERDDIQEGESWETGAVIISWDDYLRDREEGEGANVLLHEFAHQRYDTALLPMASPEAWLEALEKEYENHLHAVERGRRTFLDPYGAEDLAEFFSVTTEMFFERPEALQRRHGRLYALLRGYYRQDPAACFQNRR